MRKKILPALLGAVLCLQACAGERAPEDYQARIDPADRAEGARQNPMLLAEFGGAYQGPEADYVVRIGEKVADAAGLAGQCTFTLVNTDVVNAFAVPGCFIYITRGLIGIMTSEAQLAAVLGHEVGHIVADHAGRQQKRSVLTGLGALAVGLLTGSERLAQFAGRAGALFGLRYSRQQEFESDRLGIHYLRKAGYDPNGSAEMLDALARNEALLARTRGDDAKAIPGWARTHPLTDQRIAEAKDEAAETGVATGALPAGETAFLRQLDGLLYGDDPAQGYVQGRIFSHPDMRISFAAPAGFNLTNTPRAVLIEGPDGIRGEFGGQELVEPSLERHAARLAGQLIGDPRAVVRTGQIQRAVIGGAQAVLLPVQVRADQGALDVVVAAYSPGGRFAYHFLMVAPPDMEARRALDSLFTSFRLLSASQAARLRPREIDVVAAGPGDTVQSLSRQMAVGELPLETFLMLNDRDDGARLRPGELVKIVRYSAR